MQSRPQIMFSASTNISAINPFPNLSCSALYNPNPSSSASSLYITTTENNNETNNDDIFLYHHHHHQHQQQINPLMTTIPNLLPPTDLPMNNETDHDLNMAASSSAAAALIYNKQHNIHHVVNGSDNCHYFVAAGNKRAAVVKKKDRHSKIYTAQGLRDRRVRLSIEIARKFFDLQEILGFDTASKTLDWLLTKSKKAIKEVAVAVAAQNNGKSNLSCTNSSTCEAVSSENGDHLDEVTLPENGVSDCEKKMVKKKKLQKAEESLRAKESRAKARARARERTRRLHESKKCPPHDYCNPNCLNCRQLQEADEIKSSASKNYGHNITISSLQVAHDRVGGGPASHIMEEESIAIKRSELKPPTSSGSNLLPNSCQNWDISTSAVPRSGSFYAITNMNLSTELQLHGKLWGN